MAEWHDPERRLDDPTPAEFARWFRPEECFAHLSDGAPSQDLVNRLLKRLSDGKLVAAAAESRWKSGSQPKQRLVPTTIDSHWWLNAQDVQNCYSDLWRMGEFTCTIEYEDDEFGDDAIQVNFYGVRFEFGEMLDAVPGLKERHPRIPKVGGGFLGPGAPLYDEHQARALRVLDAMPSNERAAWEPVLRNSPPELLAPPTVRTAIPSRHAGGRPPKPFWDDMWAEMVRLMYVGGLQFSRLSEVEEAMHGWLAENNHEAGETAVRERARKLYNLLKKEDGN